MNTTARITATAMATLVMALGLGAGVASAHDEMPAGSPLAVPCDLANPEPDGPEPTEGPTDLVLPTPHPDLVGPTEIAPLPDTEPPFEPEIVIDADLVWPEEDCGGPHGGGGDPTGEPGDEPTDQGEPGTDDPDGTDGSDGPGGTDGSDGTDGGDGADGSDGTDGSGGGGSAPQAPTAGDGSLAYTGVGAGMLTAAFLTLVGAGVFALLLARTLHQRTRRP